MYAYEQVKQADTMEHAPFDQQVTFLYTLDLAATAALL